MRFVWKILPQPKMAEQPLYGAAAEGREIESIDKQKNNLGDFLKKVQNVSETERKNFLEKAKNWEIKNDYATFRQAGVTLQEDEKDPELRCRMLTSAFLEEVKGSSRLTYKVNFRGNMLAEYKIGAGDLTPPTVSVIAINGVLAVRAINPATGRKGFFWLEAYKRGVMDYAAVFTGDEIVFEETLSASDFLVQRRQIQERINLYQERGATATEAPEFSPRERDTAQRLQVSRDTRSQLGAFGREVVHQESNDPAEVLENRRRLVEVAKKYAGTRYFQEKYFDAGRPFSADVQGGRLGCALVVSDMLREAGFMNDLKTPILGVALTETELRKRGWTRTNGPIEAGDVLVWAPAGAPVADDSGQVRVRHGHIGIAISPTRCVHNSNNYEEDPSTGKKKLVFKGPVEQEITRTPVAIWKPPGARPATEARAAVPGGKTTDRQPSVATRPGGETIPTSRERPDAKLGRAIEKATSRWLPLIQTSCEKYGIEKYVPLIRAFMFMESGGNPNAQGKNKNGTFDRGLMQLNSAYFNHPDIMDPAVNIDLAVRAISQKIKRYGGNLIDIIAGYNCGHAEGQLLPKKDPETGKVVMVAATIPQSTKNTYLPKVLNYLAALGYTDVPDHGNYSDTRYA